MASNGKITVVNMKICKIKNRSLMFLYCQDSNSCKFTIKIDNFSEEFGETGKPICFAFGSDGDKNSVKW